MKYTYEITSVDTDNDMMEVTYTNENGDSMAAAFQIPTTDDDFNTYINSYAPIAHWSRMTATKATVTQGATGDIWSDHPEETEDEYNARIAAEQANT